MECRRGITTHQEGKQTIAKIFFATEEARTHFCNEVIPGDRFTIQGFPALSFGDPVVRIILTKLPFISREDLRTGIFDLLSPYRIVLEGGIY